jgi:homoserine O-acetyltransferase
MVTAISGNHHRLDFLIGPGKALDTNKYFVICTDAIANGLTTSPSNSVAQPRMKFPKFLIRDMVASQHKLLTEHLGIRTAPRAAARPIPLDAQGQSSEGGGAIH